ncbi:hypothetical protein D3C85_1492980 [compost metagenome]
MQANAEHQQHHADLGQLTSQHHIGNKTGRGRADQHPCQQVADQWRHGQARGGIAEQHGQAQPGGDGGDQGDIVRHRFPFMNRTVNDKDR